MISVPTFDVASTPAIGTVGDAIWVREMEQLKRVFHSDSTPPSDGSIASRLCGIPIIASKLFPKNKIFLVSGGRIVAAYDIAETEEGEIVCSVSG